MLNRPSTAQLVEGHLVYALSTFIPSKEILYYIHYLRGTILRETN